MATEYQTQTGTVTVYAAANLRKSWKRPDITTLTGSAQLEIRDELDRIIWTGTTTNGYITLDNTLKLITVNIPASVISTPAFPVTATSALTFVLDFQPGGVATKAATNYRLVEGSATYLPY